MEIKEHITDATQKRQLKWFGRTNRMDKTRWPGKVLECVPHEKRERGRQRRGWRDDIKRAMEARNMAKEDCYRR
jgi:hypothetical protein